MKTNLESLLWTGIACAILGCAATIVQADSITGGISFGGTFTVDTPDNLAAADWIQFGNVQVVDANGNYDGTGGTPLDVAHSGAFGPITLNPLQSTIIPLWTFQIGNVLYGFDATSVSVPFTSATVLVVEGSGIAHITGFADTAGTWNITANQAGGVTFSFSSSTAVDPDPVPDGGMTVILLGAGLSALGLLKRKLSLCN
ncbi:MAG TPA: hypothetical protein VFV23_13030 [Verrucomicrobiae bacterium]|nr:hypothetical protein [Verrucomicrobiae bacterium]